MAGQNEIFQLAFSWRETDLYSALPAFANPFLDEGIIPGQQTWNRIRNIYDVELELLPGKIVTPLLGYTRNTYDGPGTTTYHLGENEFLLNQQVHSRRRALPRRSRLQLRGHPGGLHARAGGMYRWKTVAALAPGAGRRQRHDADPRPERHGRRDPRRPQNNKINTPVTNAWITGTLFGRVKLIGTYIKADGSNETQLRRGRRRQLRVLRDRALLLGPGRDHRLPSRAPTTGGPPRGPRSTSLSNVDLSGGWAENSRVLDGQALISQPLPEHGHLRAARARGDLLREINARTVVDDMSRVYDAGVTAPLLGPFSVNAGWSQTQQNVTATPDAVRDRRPGRTGRPLRAPGQHLGRRRHVRPVRADADRRLPPRRRRPADLPDRLHSTATATGSAAPGPSRTS